MEAVFFAGTAFGAGFVAVFATGLAVGFFAGTTFAAGFVDAFDAGLEAGFFAGTAFGAGFAEDLDTGFFADTGAAFGLWTFDFELRTSDFLDVIFVVSFRLVFYFVSGNAPRQSQ